MTDRPDDLFAAAKDAMAGAYAPYSGFRVGAAVRGGSGAIYPGCNVENASYGLSMCAERSAVLRAVCSGEKEIAAVAVAGSSGEPAFPCGACRQVLAEFAPDPKSVKVHLVHDKGVDTYTLGELLPHAFKL